MRLLRALLLLGMGSCCAFTQTYTISTFAGGALPVNIPGASASLYGPLAVAVDKAGNVFFVDSNDVLRLDAVTHVVTLVAGNGTPGFSGDNSPATDAQLNDPRGVALDTSGNLYIADTLNGRIRKVTNGVMTTVSGNLGLGGSGSSQLYNPAGVAADSAGNLYIADTDNNRILKFSAGVYTTFAGTGIAGFSGDNAAAVSAELNQPGGVAVDSAGNVYIADSGNFRIRKISSGVINTVAGNGTSAFSGDNGPATSAGLSTPKVSVDSSGSLYIPDTANKRIRKVANGVITTVAGGGSGAGFSPNDVAVDSSGNLYIAASLNGNTILEVSGGAISTLAGGGTSGIQLGDNGAAGSAQLNIPFGIAVDSSGNVYFADSNDNRIRKVSSGVITTVAGNGTAGFGGDTGLAASAQLNAPQGVAADSAGNLYIADTANNRVRKVSSGVITTVAGNGVAGFSGDSGLATGASLNRPSGIALDSAGNIYIADTGNSRIRKVSSGVITTLAGNGPPAGFSGDGGAATSASLDQPAGVTVDSSGNVYIADTGNSRVREVSSGVITTLSGTGTPGFSGDGGPAASAQLAGPSGVAVDSAGYLYIADSGNARIRRVSGGVIATLTGNGVPTFGGDNGPATGGELAYPQGVAVNSAGNIYIGDSNNNRIRLLSPGTMPSITPGGIVPNDSSVSVIQPGSWVSIFGSNLASGTFIWTGNFPQTLGGTSVMIDNKPAYLWVASPTQLNLQVPDDSTTGLVSVAVTTGSGTATSTVTLSPYGPSFSLLGDGKHVAGEIATPDGSGAYGSYDLVGPANTFSYNTRPVKAGETLTLFGVGFGPTTTHVPAGQAFVGAYSTSTPVTITIGGVNAVVSFAGISEAGLYQINLTVPANTGSGDQPLQASVNGVQTPLGPVVTVQ